MSDNDLQDEETENTTADQGENPENQAAPATADEESSTDVDADDGQQAAPGDTPAEDDAGAPRNNKGAERRIRQLTRKYRDAERENKKLQARLDNIEQRIGPAPKPVRPSRDDFDSVEEYEDALLDWRDATKAAESQTSTKPDDQQITDGGEILDELEAELEDISDDAAHKVMETDWACNTAMTEFIVNSEVRAPLAYHLASNPDTAAKIAKMSPVLAARELAKVEAKIVSEQKLDANAPGKNTLPPPVNPNKPSANVLDNDDKLSDKQWVEKRRKAQEARAH